MIARADALAVGLKRYFTGRPCRRGHEAERAACDHTCVECSRLKARDPAVRDRRRSYFAEHQRQYRKAHPDRVRATKLKPGLEALAAAKREQRAKNPELHRAALSRSFQRHKAKRMAETAAWRAANREAARHHNRAAKAKRRAAVGTFTKDDIRSLFDAQCGICAACSADIADGYHIDHMTPLSRGGTNWPVNLQLLCAPCNQSKGNKTMEEWTVWKAAYSSAGCSAVVSACSST